MHRPVAMKKSVIKRRKRVVPTTNEQEQNAPQLSTFPVSPTPAPQRVMSPDAQGHPKYSGSMDAPSPLDLRPNPGHLDSPEVRNRQRIDASMDSNSPSNLALRQHEQQVEPHPYEPPPIEVDFTGYRLDQRQDFRRRPSGHPQQNLPSLSSIHDPSLQPTDPVSLTSRLSPLPNSSSRKRSYDNAERDNASPSTPQNSTKRLSSISSLLNHPQQSSSEEMPIDPNLSSIGQQQPHLHRHSHPESQPHRYQLPPPDTNRLRQSTSSDPGGWELRERRARLRREADQIREMLRAKEREIEELDGEG